MRIRARSRAGLTLVEMTVVVSILGVLASVAIPRYRAHVHRAQRTEAYYGLRTIHDLQTSYFGKEMRYSDSFQEIGPPLTGGTLREDGSIVGQRYTFTLDTWDLGGVPDSNYRATATADLDPSDATLDILIIENDLTVIE